MPTQEWIRDLLKTKGHKLKDIAETLDISAPRVTDILKGAREVQSDEILKLANLLGLSATSLLESLSAGELIDNGPLDNVSIDNVSAAEPARIAIEGTLMGDGRILPLLDTATIRSVAPPPDADTTEGLTAYIMGDDVLENEIKQGSIIIAADPRKHFYPMVPGAIFLINQNNSDGTKRLLPRQYHKTETGEDWLIPLPKTPNPAFASLRFEISVAPTPSFIGHQASNPQPAANSGMQDQIAGLHVSPVYTDDIFAAVLWVHLRYMPS
ncbi:helix-turn-helix transcriptional regulator [Kordiimonas sp. SCSIO 12610]|uniref:helix-turn-helix domain-containing protein n=1 Tax=Kordiimonas sp. SCSIO 12610 TaxID=2829597 RepID=UPI00210B8ED7|nr:helix-turn-helix transcriptional regulator [Kordiimonas sp. SCSIO 12610]UTW56150.1 helix-turn-helix transcriptional regulator [Kordiimonas sp. SCSIO 12610]